VEAGEEELPPGTLYAIVDETEAEQYELLGFVRQRRESTYLIPVEAIAAELPPGLRMVGAAEADLDRLRELDDLLRQDLHPGWRWKPEDFREETFQPAFDPRTYVIAAAADEYVALVRVWHNPSGWRLGFVGVRRDWRRRGIARALVAQVFGVLLADGVGEVTAEIDYENAASRALFDGLGARPVRAHVELCRSDGAAARVRVRPSLPDDAEAIAVIQVRSSQAGFAEIFPAEALATLDPEPRVALWRERLPLVAENGDGIIGFAHVGPSEDEAVGEIYRFFVLPERWGEGVGRALMARALEQLRMVGFEEAILWVHADNRRARRFYEAGGWRLDGAEKDVESFGIPVTEVRYRIRLR
jgi:GNAT superfamily N-acetyltransferase